MNVENFESKKELSAEEKQYQEILENEGFVYLGIQEGMNGNDNLVVFRTGEKHDWKAGMSIPVKDFNLENLRIKVQEKEKIFKNAN